jgi:radical SAM superfamily enzyme YgiQ (UPF0313 family)
MTGSADLLIQEACEREAYDFMCTGATSAYYNQVKTVVSAVRTARSGTRVILGGGLVTSEPLLIFEALQPDYLVVGEGETTICELLDAISTQRPISEVPGVAFRNATGNILMTAPRAPNMTLDSLPWPEFEGFGFTIPLDHARPTDDNLFYIQDSPRVYPILGSRSCPYLCTFCFHPLGNKYRERSVGDILGELAVQIPKYHINIVTLYDELFSRHKARVYEFCDGMRKLRASLSWECVWTCGMRVDDVDEEMLRTMKESGCYLIGYGFESYSEEVLKSMKKGTKPPMIDHAVRLTLASNISVLGNFIFGDLAETLETARTTLDYWGKHAAAAINLNFITPYPGTHIYRRSVERGVIKDRLQYIIAGMPLVNCTESMSGHDFARLAGEVFVAKLKYNALAYPKAYRKNAAGTYDISLKCPHCGKHVTYGNCSTVRAMASYDLHCRACSYHFFLVSRVGYVGCRIVSRLLTVLPPRLQFALFLIVRRVQTWGR